MDSMYDTLMSLPLLSGISSELLHNIVARTKFYFSKFNTGDTIVEAGAPCARIKFIISGAVRTSIANRTGKFRVSQTLKAPDVLAPDFLFGRSTNYPFTARALTSTGIMEIDKSEYITLLMSDQVLLFNLLNLISTNAQKSVDGVLALTSGSLEERIAFWITSLTRSTAHDIVMECNQRDLYTYFGVGRSSFFATLEHMQNSGLITYTPTEIRFHDRTRLVDLITR